MKVRQLIRSRYGTGIYLLQLLVLSCGVVAARNEDLYKVLGVPRDASDHEIKKAYRKQALKHHPDKGGSEEHFKEINEAFDILSNADKRKHYDQFGDANAASSSPHTPPPPNFFGGAGAPPGADFFQFFQQGSGSSHQQQSSTNFFRSFGSSGMGAGSTSSMENLKLDEILKQFMGANNGAQQQQQSRFNNRQNTFDLRRQESKKWFTRKVTCSLEELATGATKKYRVKHSIGQKPVSKVYQITIKPGWKDGTKLKFPPTKAGLPGMIFIIKERLHSVFRREGDDLVFNCKLSQKEAEEGTTISVDLPDGEKWVYEIPKDYLPIGGDKKDDSSYSSRKVLSIRNKGMPIKGGPKRGNLIVKFVVLRTNEGSTTTSAR